MSINSGGDVSGITFSINSSGQVQYVSTNVGNWTSGTFRYYVTQTSKTGTYTSLLNPTVGSYSVNSIQFNDTTDAVNGISNGPLYVLGGGTIAKSLNVGTTVSTSNLISSNINVTSLTSGSFVMSSSYTNGNYYSLNITSGKMTFVNPSYGYLWFENNTVQNMMLSSGNLTVTGDITGFGNLSDKRLKTNINDIEQDESLRVINSLRPVTFNWKDDIFNEAKRGTEDAGFIAQEVEEVIPVAVSDYAHNDIQYKNIKFERILPYLVGSIQKLTKENSELKMKLSEILKE